MNIHVWISKEQYFVCWMTGENWYKLLYLHFVNNADWALRGWKRVVMNLFLFYSFVISYLHLIYAISSGKRSGFWSLVRVIISSGYKGKHLHYIFHTYFNLFWCILLWSNFFELIISQIRLASLTLGLILLLISGVKIITMSS